MELGWTALVDGRPWALCGVPAWALIGLLMVALDLTKQHSTAMASPTTTQEGSSPQEYCQWDTFNATCEQNQVVVMETAHYGRLRLGRCVRRGYGHIGCSADVLPFADSRCSGSTQCKIGVSEISLQGIRPCPVDFTSYFEASYKCIDVTGLDTLQKCHLATENTLTNQNGYIASPDIASSHSVASPLLGTSHCNWIIRVAPGQRVNISLLDFSTYPASSGPDSRPLDPSMCRRVALLKDRGQQGREAHVCGGRDRQRSVFVSRTHEVEVVMFSNLHEPGDQSMKFLVKYEAIGCARPVLPPGVTVVSEDDVLLLTCNVTGEKWALRCVATSWVGKQGNCTRPVELPGLWGVRQHDWTSPYGLLIVIGLGVLLGVAIGISLLGLVLLVMKRRHGKRRGIQIADDEDEYDSRLDPYTGDPVVRVPSYCRNSYRKEPDMDYNGTMRAQTRPTATPSLIVEYGKTVGNSGYQTMSVDTSVLRSDLHLCAVPTNVSRDPSNSHIYESPKFQKREELARCVNS